MLREFDAFPRRLRVFLEQPKVISMIVDSLIFFYVSDCNTHSILITHTRCMHRCYSATWMVVVFHWTLWILERRSDAKTPKWMEKVGWPRNRTRCSVVATIFSQLTILL